MASSLFPDGVCVIACSGPSLNEVDCSTLGIPVIAISTAIRTLKRPNYWALADTLNALHGDEGKDAWKDPSIMKVVPRNKNTKLKTGHHPDFIMVDCQQSNRSNCNVALELFDPNLPYLRGPHKTVLMALQWAHCNGANNIIFAGNDLFASSLEAKYSYTSNAADLKKKHNFLKTLDQVDTCMFNWYPHAKRKGFEWYSWKCGSAFDKMSVKFDPSMLDSLKKTNIDPPKPMVIVSPSVRDVPLEQITNVPAPLEKLPKSDMLRRRAKFKGISNKAMSRFYGK